MAKKKKGKNPKEFDVEDTFNAGENKVMEEADKLEKQVMTPAPMGSAEWVKEYAKITNERIARR
jgi:hypothetical protein|tara:strand:- start:11646 stop:11837 length:192 start_codon:yes stop_codon:yes gene_type:complete